MADDSSAGESLKWETIGIKIAGRVALSGKNQKYRSVFDKWATKYWVWYQRPDKPEFVEAHRDLSCQFFMKSLAKEFAPSSCWTISAYVKDYLLYAHDVPRKGGYDTTNNFLKENGNGYQPKKADFLKFDEYELYWGDDEEEKDHLGLLRKTLSMSCYYAAIDPWNAPGCQLET